MIVTFAVLVTLTAVCSTAPDTDLNLEEQKYEDWLTTVDSFTETRGKRSLINLVFQSGLWDDNENVCNGDLFTAEKISSSNRNRTRTVGQWVSGIPPKNGELRVHHNQQWVGYVEKCASALKALLSKTTRLQNSYYHNNIYRNYMKHGDLQTALKDFESFSPVSIRTRTTDSGVKVITGVIEDKILKIRTPGYKFNSEAVLDVFDKRNKVPGKRYFDSIIYTKKTYGQK